MFGGRQTMARIPASLQTPSLSVQIINLYNPDHCQLKLMSAMSMNYTTLATGPSKKSASISNS